MIGLANLVKAYWMSPAGKAELEELVEAMQPVIDVYIEEVLRPCPFREYLRRHK